ncbi:MAG TPA: type VI secretion system protein TssA [Gammaproteobacteria bacterium]
MTDALAQLGSEPVSADAPGGSSARYEAEFAALEEELAKQESLTAQSVDWGRVVELATHILRSQSKDLLVAAYLARGLQEREGMAGLAMGLGVVRDISANFWDELFPPAKRLRARATAVQWMAEKCGAGLAAKPPGPADDGAVTAAAEAVRALDQLLLEKMPDDAPSLRELLKPLQDFKSAAEARAKKAAAPAATPAATPAASSADAAVPAPAATAPRPAPAAAPATSVVTDVGNDNDARKALRNIQDTARKVADFWLAGRATDPRAFRITRMATWLLIDQAPPAENNRTQLNPPAPEKLKAFQIQFEQGQFDKLVPELEQSVARTPFWLDGQHLSFRALTMLGPAAADAAAAVQAETLHFVERLPAMLDLAFSDGTPFANDATRLWLEEARGAKGGSAGGGAAEAAPWSEAFRDARAQAAKGEVQKAVAAMQAGLAKAGSASERFHWRLSMAELLAGAGQTSVAAALLESLAEEIELRKLDEWQPALAAAVFTQLVNCYRKESSGKKPNPDAAGKLEKAHASLSRLDPGAALEK